MKWTQYKTWLAKQLTGNEGDPSSIAPSPDRITTDSRSITNGDFFIPIVGEKFDGHKFIKSAIEQGACAFLYERSKESIIDPDLLKLGIPVQDTLKALQLIATGWLELITPKHVVAITGSVGKTTVKEMLGCVFDLVGKSHYTKSSFNNEIGVPLTILKAPKNTDHIILEFGARHPGDIAFLCEIASPTIAVVLNTKAVHVGEFGSFEKLVETKTEMYRNSKSTALLIVPDDDPNLISIATSTKKEILTFGKSPDSDVAISNITWGKNSDMSVDVKIDGSAITTHLSSAHESYPINIAAATAIAYAAGIDIKTISKGISQFKPAPGRFEILKEKNFTIINDAYNASPASMLAAFKSLSHLYPKSNIGMVLGDMNELGETSDAEHIKIGNEAVSLVKPSRLICIGKFSNFLEKGANEAGLNNENIQSFKSVEDLIDNGFSSLSSCDVIFLKASNSVRFNKLLKPLKDWGESL